MFATGTQTLSGHKRTGLADFILWVMARHTNQVVTSLNIEVKGSEPDFPEKTGRIALEMLAEKVGPAITADFAKVIDR